RYLQANNILALKLEHAVAGAEKAVANQIETIGAGAKRALYYTSCFTDEYQDVCLQQKTEDIRFKNGVIYLLQHGNHCIRYAQAIILNKYSKTKLSEELERIKRILMAVNIHIAASSLTNAGFALATASFVATGINLNLELSALAGRRAGGVVGAIGIYGIVQKAAESAHRLCVSEPAYYSV
ncbi:hypothetical protein CQA07_27055, partial [Klebsiella pneumoniae]|uniref:hypothetical protein n=1 Tax=Klebsiella pneumoniae TaxID=573 RepID=UPI000BDD760B